MSNKHPIERATAAPEEAEVTVPDRNAPHRVPHDAEGKPDLGRLIRRYGSYDRVPAEAGPPTTKPCGASSKRGRAGFLPAPRGDDTLRF